MDSQLSPIGRFERILLATDATPRSVDAQRIAMAMARAFGAALHLASVIVTHPIAEEVAYIQVEAAGSEVRELLERLEKQAQDMGIAAQKILLLGRDPLEMIVQAAEEHRADLIVMGRREKPGLLRRIVGTTTTKAIGSARCPVLVVPEGATMWQRRILLATDGSRFSDAAAVAAARLAEACRLPVSVISTIRASFSAERAAQAAEAAARVHGYLAARQIEADQAVLNGEPDELIVSSAAAFGADLIVIGTHGRTGWERLGVGSVAESVVKSSPLPVLAVKL
ncbi:MAG TPA: universal stress protein [Burkholderiaceae bacterium]|jgi:nucleotide-binding universal stress UspA family protein|nr:universal stress protein [Burkholderiaceae bacterium]